MQGLGPPFFWLSRYGDRPYRGAGPCDATYFPTIGPIDQDGRTLADFVNSARMSAVVCIAHAFHKGSDCRRSRMSDRALHEAFSENCCAAGLIAGAIALHKCCRVSRT